MKAITVSELKARAGKVVDDAIAGTPCLIVRNGKFAILQPTEVIPADSAKHQKWMDEAFASGAAEEKTEADWRALKRRALGGRG
jgi:prevent-host-death family protein